MRIIPFQDCNSPSFDFKYMSLCAHKFRLDRIAIQRLGSKEVLRKTTHFGMSYGSLAQVYDFIDIISDIRTKSLIQINTSITNKELDDRVPINFVFPEFTRDNLIDINQLAQDYEIHHIQLIDNTDFIHNINIFEDSFNMDYTETLGPFVALISGATMLAPFSCNLIIDSKDGFVYKNERATIKDPDIIMMSQKAFCNFMKGIDVLYKHLKDICEKEETHVRMYIIVNEFTTYIRFTDLKNNNLTFSLNLNNSDHCRMLRYLDACVGPKYSNSDVFGQLLDTDCQMLIPTLFENDYSQYEFLKAEYAENYVSEYINV